MEILFLFLGLVLGGIVTWLYFKNKSSSTFSEKQKEFNELDKERSVLNDRLSAHLQQVNHLSTEVESERKKYLELSTQLAQQKTINQNLDEKLANQKRDLEELQTRFNKDFENLANRILDEKSQKF